MNPQLPGVDPDGIRRGDCPVCGQRFTLRGNGAVWHHRGSAGAYWCPGSGQLAAEVGR